MRAASSPRAGARLLVIDPARDALVDRTIDDIAELVGPGDVVVVNDAATLPASLVAQGPRGEPMELRLLGIDLPAGEARAVLFGAGDHRTRTENRPAPPPLVVSDEMTVGPLHTTVTALDGRIATLRFDRSGDALASAIYALGRPIQYAHVPLALDLWSVQTVYASRPWAIEMPSAGRPLTAATIARMRARGAEVVPLTHAAGISTTGDASLDARLPLPERYEIPEKTAAAVRRAKRVLAVGTSVVRALEGCFATFGEVRAVRAVTDLRIGKETQLKVVDALLSGLHERGTSHFELLSAFASEDLLLRANAHADANGYLGHELGDAILVLPRAVAVDSRRERERARVHRWCAA